MKSGHYPSLFSKFLCCLSCYKCSNNQNTLSSLLTHHLTDLHLKYPCPSADYKISCVFSFWFNCSSLQQLIRVWLVDWFQWNLNQQPPVKAPVGLNVTLWPLGGTAAEQCQEGTVLETVMLILQLPATYTVALFICCIVNLLAAICTVINSNE